jgi:hypothetical protein
LAIDNINLSIKLQPQSPSAYNLLALLLSSRGKFQKSLEIVIAGWKSCLSRFADVGNSDNVILDISIAEQNINWEVVDPFIKEEFVK